MAFVVIDDIPGKQLSTNIDAYNASNLSTPSCSFRPLIASSTKLGLTAGASLTKKSVHFIWLSKDSWKLGWLYSSTGLTFGSLPICLYTSLANFSVYKIMKSFYSGSLSVISSINTCKIASAIFCGIENPRDTMLWITSIFSSIYLSDSEDPSSLT